MEQYTYRGKASRLPAMGRTIKTGHSQSPRDRILWILSDSGGKMNRSRLRRCTGIKLADLDSILGKLARAGRIRITREVKLLI